MHWFVFGVLSVVPRIFLWVIYSIKKTTTFIGGTNLVSMSCSGDLTSVLSHGLEWSICDCSAVIQVPYYRCMVVSVANIPSMDLSEHQRKHQGPRCWPYVGLHCYRVINAENCPSHDVICIVNFAEWKWKTQTFNGVIDTNCFGDTNDFIRCTLNTDQHIHNSLTSNQH